MAVSDPRLTPPADPSRYLLANVRIPPALVPMAAGADGWCAADVLIEAGSIAAVEQAGTLAAGGAQRVDADHSILMSGLVDCHVHLDKAHVAAFDTFPPADLSAALAAMAENKKTWTRESLAERVEFSLRSAHAYGVRAMRSHVDFAPPSPAFAWEVMREAVERWKGRIALQLSPLAGIMEFDDADFCNRAFAACREQGVLGLFVYDQPGLAGRLKPLFAVAGSEGWDLDIHVDEGVDVSLDGLNAVAEAALATGFTGRALCGHCVALSSYDAPRRERVVDRALEAGLHFVSLPVTNLYLQGRGADGISGPRGMAPVGYLADRGATVSVGADNVRDGFCAFGEFDPVAVLNLGAQVGHLDEPARDWAGLITVNPAASMRLGWDGRIAPGAPADLVLFSARSSGELSARGGLPRTVIRGGEWLDAEPPDFRELTG